MPEADEKLWVMQFDRDAEFAKHVASAPKQDRPALLMGYFLDRMEHIAPLLTDVTLVAPNKLVGLVGVLGHEEACAKLADFLRTEQLGNLVLSSRPVKAGRHSRPVELSTLIAASD
ncbi:hypothetical protein A3D88_01100 [Candidatus Peribacteria bacterium RIFCSPHIGHO2_02_FULL_52_16]|nr:MAG: hypothetical protein A2706_05745 [Candidatus Peribacteria bacterium RIFCSPHIGHO2_01_FULL_51_35]OGJ61262.1 MAG: hypothetical protein A3D88_01100 [Candidatus Peribacteria bacterium RIFCSPHIGHO2_02_FULL_52_16]